jgi:beta-aspartyl-peptidase (threonine type)
MILVHGGAGMRSMTAPQAAWLRAALEVGYHLLDQGGSAAIAVEQAIRVLERSGRFNAGTGSRLQLDGARRMDASIMEGAGLRAGAVASIESIVHPITAARLVMEETTHVLLVGPPATRFARYFNLDVQPCQHRSRSRPRSGRLSVMSVETLRVYRSMMKRGLARGEASGKETVGAVALDQSGTLAAGASTGGIDLMLPGRVGDTPLVGCGVYADNQSGAVSMTGQGEGIIRLAVAKEICDGLAHRQTPPTAARLVLRRLVARIKGTAGCLVLAPTGRFAIAHVTPRMAAGWWNGRGQPLVGDRFR